MSYNAFNLKIKKNIKIYFQQCSVYIGQSLFSPCAGLDIKGKKCFQDETKINLLETFIFGDVFVLRDTVENGLEAFRLKPVNCRVLKLQTVNLVINSMSVSQLRDLKDQAIHRKLLKTGTWKLSGAYSSIFRALCIQSYPSMSITEVSIL